MHDGLGQCYLALKKIKKSLSEFNAAVDLMPNN
jgi:hypothetical protein